jgi:hypothetical protein
MNKKYLATLLLLCSHAFAADPVLIFGLPLGGVWAANPKICPFNTDNARQFCWVGKPFLPKDGGKYGTIHFPNTDALPEWAAYASFTLSLTKSRVIESVSVETIDARDKNNIAKSISTRFGAPKSQSLNRTDLAIADWVAAGVSVNLMCADKCQIIFRSTEAQIQHEKYINDGKKRDANRPLTP